MATDAHVGNGVLTSALRVRGLSKSYLARGRGWLSRFQIAAVKDVSFDIPAGKTFALLGSSGSK